MCLRINDVRKTEIQTAEPLVSEPNTYEVEMANEVSKDTNQQILIKFQQIWLKQDVEIYVQRQLLPLRRKCLSSVIVDIYSKGDKTDCNTYWAMSLLTTKYQIWSNVFLSRWTIRVEEIFGIFIVDFELIFNCLSDNVHLSNIRKERRIPGGIT